MSARAARDVRWRTHAARALQGASCSSALHTWGSAGAHRSQQLLHDGFDLAGVEAHRRHVQQPRQVVRAVLEHQEHAASRCQAQQLAKMLLRKDL